MAAALDGQVFSAVLFDLDGTLIDSTGVVERTWRRWADEYGLEPGWLPPHGIPARQVLGDVVPAADVESALARVSSIELADVDGVVLLPGAAEALAALPADRVAIVTSGVTVLAELRTTHTGLAVPPVLVTADDVAVGKPDPAPYLLAARRLGVDPARCLVVEDAPAGLVAGRAAGCTTLAVATTHPAADLDADVVVPDLAAVAFSADPAGIRVRLSDPRVTLPG